MNLNLNVVTAGILPVKQSSFANNTNVFILGCGGLHDMGQTCLV